MGRCARDFISDAKRAHENGFYVGCLLSLLRANTYIDRLATTERVCLPEIGETYIDYWTLVEYHAGLMLDDFTQRLFGKVF